MMRSDNPNTYVIRPKETLMGLPPDSSYWVGATRAELNAAILARRPQMATASEKDLAFDLLIGATAAWAEAKQKSKSRKVLRGVFR